MSVLVALGVAYVVMVPLAFWRASRAKKGAQALEREVALLRHQLSTLTRKVSELDGKAKTAAQPVVAPVSARDLTPEAPAGLAGIAPTAIPTTAQTEPLTPASISKAPDPQNVAPTHGAAPSDVPTPPSDVSQATPPTPTPAESAGRKSAPTPPEAATAPAATAPPSQPPPGAPPGPRAAGPWSTAPTIDADPPNPIDWERWLGVRGAAVLGGIVLALAGLLFFKYSVEHGLISPTLRVVTGTLVGVGCIVGSEKLRGRYGVTANALAGGGAVLLYAAFWAASVLYRLVGMEVAFGLMALTTATCSLLAIRRNSLLIALLGLVGGFATPLMLASGSDRPFGLFGYILLLDVAFLFIAHKRGWPILGLLSLVGTLVIEALWMSMRMGPQRSVLGLSILGVFAVVFAIGIAIIAKRPTSAESARGRMWLLTQASSTLAPFAFALYFAANAKLGIHFFPVALLMIILGLAACVLSRRMAIAWLAYAAAASSIAVLVGYLATHSLTPALVWEVSASAFGLALAFHLFFESDAARNPAALTLSGAVPHAAVVAALGLLLVLALAAPHPGVSTPWPWLAGWTGLAMLLYRQGSFEKLAWAQLAAAISVGISLGLFHSAHAERDGFPDLSYYLAAEALVAMVFASVALVRDRQRFPEGTRFASYAGAIFPAIVLFSLIGLERFASEKPLLALGAPIALALLSFISATRTGTGLMMSTTGIALALVHSVWALAQSAATAENLPALATSRAADRIEQALVAEAAAMLLVGLWPILAGSRFRRGRAAWYASALSVPAWFFALKHLFELRFGTSAIGVLPTLLGLYTMFLLLVSRRGWPVGDAIRKSAIVWYATVALACLSVAIPLQLDKEWITIGWSLEALAVTALWKRLDHPGLKWLGLLLHLVVTFRLCANPYVLDYHPRGTWRIVNWLLYTYAVPTVSLLGTARILVPLEVARLRKWEEELYHVKKPRCAEIASLCAIIMVFVWINLAIADWFSLGRELTLSFERRPAKDLTMSIAWAAYAVALLAIGMARGSRALRWVSLTVLIVTIGKVFLYDLGQLRDLYRVMSLLGLAVSLISVSLAYQRFVFKRQASSAQDEAKKSP